MEPADISLSPACRILVVSKDIAQGQELVSRIAPLASHPLTPHLRDETYIEWIIQNKYYTAPVHLYLHEVSKPPAKPLWPPEAEEERVPALIFVFRKGEAYRDVFLSMREAYLAHNAEVAIAVSLPPSASNDQPTDSFDGTEEFFSAHNFEYVDAEDTPEERNTERLLSEVRGLPRILEALNMIMWPSMIRTSKGGLRRNNLAADLQTSPPTDIFEHSFATISDTAPPDHPSLFEASPGAMSRGLAELNAWLDNDDSWASNNRGGSVGTREEPDYETDEPGGGFEDDFTDFLSVPPGTSSFVELPSPVDVHATAERIFAGGQNNDAPEGFDLTSMLGALEAMRLEIGAIEDMEERRVAAARVALGLAMGLGLDERSEGQGPPDEELIRELHQLQGDTK